MEEKEPEGKIAAADISKKHDFMWALMNTVPIEEHLIRTYWMTKDEKILEVHAEIRRKRAEMLKTMRGFFGLGSENEVNTELWCICKHLPAAAMRTMETAYKCEGEERKALMGLAEYFYGLMFVLLEYESDLSKEGQNRGVEKCEAETSSTS